MLILTEVATPIYFLDVIIGSLLLIVLFIDRETQRMSKPHAAFFTLMACGLISEGVFRLTGIDDPMLYEYTLLMRKTGWSCFVLSLAIRQIIDRTQFGRYA